MTYEEFLNKNNIVLNSKDAFNIGAISDGYHTFDDLYYFRMLYNAAFFNLFFENGGRVFKSPRHSDGKLCFDGGWFIVQAYVPIGDNEYAQISNHYEMKYWHMFKVEALDQAEEWDGHSEKDVQDRLMNYIKRF